MDYLKKGPAEIMLFKKDAEAHSYLTRVSIPCISKEIFQRIESENQWIKIPIDEVGFTEGPPNALELQTIQENFPHWKITYDEQGKYLLAAPKKE
jgi:hypothetical protein